ncbi:MAG: substrate-binding domain-containing protein [Desulfuromonadales bacterium]|nr:substrate-binding domain-containing protein [Desulfuromonadales bacterium]
MMSKITGFLGYFLLLAGLAVASVETATPVLRVYGPGGPYHALSECADLYRDRYGVEVQVVRALPHDLAEWIRVDGDIYYGGAPCMLEEFVENNPGLLDLASVELLYPRQVGIVVRAGNPLGIEGLGCLTEENVGLLDVKLENMRQLHNAFTEQPNNLKSLVYTGRQGLRAWRNEPEIDAWVTYRSWHVKLDDADFIELPPEQGLRYTPLALTTRTAWPQQARNFLEFLKSEDACRIFQKHGWD